MNTISTSVFCVLTYVLLSTVTISDATRVSRSFQRGYLLGYAKGLDEARHIM